MLVKARKYYIPCGGRRRHNSNYYKLYLQSDHWKDIREEKLANIPHCNRCKQTNCLEVHHLTYDTLWKESLDDLEVLCHVCHVNEHNLPKRLRKLPEYKPKKKKIKKIKIPKFVLVTPKFKQYFEDLIARYPKKSYVTQFKETTKPICAKFYNKLCRKERAKIRQDMHENNLSAHAP